MSNNVSTSSADTIRVAIVEDHSATRVGLASGLRNEEGLQIVWDASHFHVAIELCKKDTPDVLLLDLHLPDSPSIRTLLEAFAPYCKRIIFFTAEERQAFVEEALSLGVWGYISKSEPLPVVAGFIRRAWQGEKPVLSSEVNLAKQRLTDTDKSILQMLAQGMKYEQMALARRTQPDTVKKQCERLMAKLSIKTREELISWAALHGYANVHENKDPG